MKKLFNIAFFIIGFVFLQAQTTEDLQWLVRDGHHKVGGTISTNDYSQNLLGNNFNINNVSYPRSQNIINGRAVVYANNFFGIYNNGKYVIYNDGFDQNYNPTIVGGYSIAGNAPFKYFYLANIYEEDDPPEDVTIDDGSTLGKRLNLSTTAGYFGAVNPIVGRKDFTIIIDGSYIPQNNTQYSLCHSNPQGVSFIASEFENGINYINQDVLSTSQKSFANNCITIVNDDRNKFFNFRANITNAASFDTSVVFSLKNRQEIITTDTVSISSKFHDPNYIKVNCVWEENHKCYVSYEVFCYNESTDAFVDNVKVRMTLPEVVVENGDINKVRVNIGRSACCKDAEFTLNGRDLEIVYDGRLDTFPEDITPAVIALFEFCAPINCEDSDGNNINLGTVNLQPILPTTTFSNNDGLIADYPIETFIDTMGSFKPNRCDILFHYCFSNELVSFSRNIEQCSDCICRESLKCKISKPITIAAIFFGIGGAGLALRRRKKRKNV